MVSITPFLMQTDTDTLGPISLFAHVSGALTVKVEGIVLAANIYDSVVAATDNLQVDLVQWIGSAPNALTSGRVDSSVGAYQTGLTPLQPTVAGRTLDVTTTGEAGIDWANIGSPTTSVNLSGTTISTSQAVASVSGSVASVTAAVTLNAKDTLAIRNNTAQAGAAGTITLDASASATTDFMWANM